MTRKYERKGPSVPHGTRIQDYPEKLRNAIIDDLRAGLLSRVKIAERHRVKYTAVLRFSRMLGAEGDLRPAVQKKAEAEIMAMRQGDNTNDAVVVNENALVILELVRDHSNLVRRARNISVVLLQDLEDTIRNRDEIERTIKEKCAEDASPVREMQMMRAVSLPTNTKTLMDLAGAMKTLIGLEREMFNIGKGDEGRGTQSLEDYVMSLPGESVRVIES